MKKSTALLQVFAALFCIALACASCKSAKEEKPVTEVVPIAEEPIAVPTKTEEIAKAEPAPPAAEPVIEKVEAPKPAPVIEPKVEPKVEPKIEQKPEPKVEPKVEKPVIKEEPKPAPQKEEPPVSEEAKEYQRSVSTLGDKAISIDAFQEDKKDIMNIIDDLNDVMKNKDYNTWLNYISDGSKEYWSNPANLASVANRLPIKGIKIKSLRDYFIFVFIPSRANSKVEEIRYISPVLVKAVEPKENEDLIYYIFEKSKNDGWKIKLDMM